jgi:multisubunit Na+/H+ antiporter MnhG subunit
MEIIFEILFSFIGEFVLQILMEALAEIGLHSMRETWRRPPNPWFAAIGYALFGAIAGGLSLLFLPKLLVHSHTLQLANVILTPIAAGLAMMAMGAWRRRRDQEIIRLDKFAYGFLFALAMALVRFHFGS